MNSLAREKSPYLRRHSENPVNWLPWGEVAFNMSRELQRPIFLSIGYSSCHWCSVMERESFMDPKVAEFLNRHFVPVKVDREELPEVDEFYMRAVQAMTGHGGWPLTVFLTPDLKPFFGGTYFPPKRSMGLPSFMEVLRAVVNAWNERREELIKSSEEVTSLLRASLSTNYVETDVTMDPMSEAYDQLVMSFDNRFGGFGGAPKFPMPTYLRLIARFYWWRRERLAALMLDKTLRNMYQGGIYDQVGGGFHRYSTDNSWTIPHFEKMLYDNALLLGVYAEAHKLLGVELFKECALDVIAWLLREMFDGNGFFAAVDADSEGEEGRYYVWRRSELLELFGESVGEVVSSYYGVTDGGNFNDGMNVLTVRGTVDEISSALGTSPAEAVKYVRTKLRSHREKRAPPFIDKKIITSWNGLLISSLAYAGWIWNQRDLIEVAMRVADFLTTKLFDGESLWRYWLDGPSRHRGSLEDYSHLTNALIDLYSYSGREKYLEIAEMLIDVMLKEFRSDSGALYNVPRSYKSEHLRVIDAVDGVVPSGNSMAVSALAKMHQLTGRSEYLDSARRIVLNFWDRMRAYPLNYTYMISNLGLLTPEAGQLFCAVGEEDLEECSLRVGSSIPFHPYLSVATFSETRRPRPLEGVTGDKKPIDGRTAFYYCKGFTCNLPTTELERLREMLKSTASNR
ncbi:MAG: thioredoxin domain-containing protein [Aigarchaeota archaeon]|nr:thioredoxin domain-containing protein [Aigarchaeota archaeon]MDW8092900.1 thioredoxin domain-containing protein [Nitrososphaerota archaeon]